MYVILVSKILMLQFLPWRLSPTRCMQSIKLFLNLNEFNAMMLKAIIN